MSLKTQAVLVVVGHQLFKGAAISLVILVIAAIAGVGWLTGLAEVAFLLLGGLWLSLVFFAAIVKERYRRKLMRGMR